MEIPWKIEAGKGLRVYHGQALVINPGTVIGANCTLRQSTTIGNKQSANGAFGEGKSPVIGNNVDVGSNVCIIGDIIVGNNVVIGAGTIVVKDVPDDSVIVGNPARIVRPRTDKLDQSI
ncbi:serine acetyltransferase [Compostibacter hankyongensis]